jgi:hypothetical protein
MKNYFWTSGELDIIEEWDWVSKFVNTQIPTAIPVNDIIRKLTLEARLLIANKLVIFYGNSTNNPLSIISFKELLTISERNRYLEEKIYFHPINFKTLDEYRGFLNRIREKLFSLSN